MAAVAARLRYVALFDKYLGTLHEHQWQYVEIVAYVETRVELRQVLRWTERLSTVDLCEIVDSAPPVPHVARFIELLDLNVRGAIVAESARAILYLSIKYNYVSLVRMSIRAGVDADVVLQRAIEVERVKIVAVALERGAKVSRANLLAAIVRSDVRAVQLMVATSTDAIDAVVAHTAVAHGNRAIVECVLRNGDVDIEAPDMFGRTLGKAIQESVTLTDIAL